MCPPTLPPKASALSPFPCQNLRNPQSDLYPPCLSHSAPTLYAYPPCTLRVSGDEDGAGSPRLRLWLSPWLWPHRPLFTMGEDDGVSCPSVDFPPFPDLGGVTAPGNAAVPAAQARPTPDKEARRKTGGASSQPCQLSRGPMSPAQLFLKSAPLPPWPKTLPPGAAAVMGSAATTENTLQGALSFLQLRTPSPRSQG